MWVRVQPEYTYEQTNRFDRKTHLLDKKIQQDCTEIQRYLEPEDVHKFALLQTPALQNVALYCLERRGINPFSGLQNVAEFSLTSSIFRRHVHRICQNCGNATSIFSP